VRVRALMVLCNHRRQSRMELRQSELRVDPECKSAIRAEDTRQSWVECREIEPMSSLGWVESWKMKQVNGWDAPAITRSTLSSLRKSSFSADDWIKSNVWPRPNASCQSSTKESMVNARDVEVGPGYSSSAYFLAFFTIPSLGSTPMMCLKGISSTVAWPVPFQHASQRERLPTHQFHILNQPRYPIPE